MVVVVELEVEEETGNKAGSTVRLVGLCREHLDARFCGVVWTRRDSGTLDVDHICLLMVEHVS